MENEFELAERANTLADELYYLWENCANKDGPRVEALADAVAKLRSVYHFWAARQITPEQARDWLAEYRG